MAGVLVHHFGTPKLELGTYGVILFFVLSGFLITGILLRVKTQVAAGTITLWRALKLFYARRFLRIFPIYYLTLAVLFACNIPGVRAHIGWHVLYATNIWVAIHQHFEKATGQFWSLAVEEQFYLIWPIFILLTPMKWLRTVAISLAALGVSFRFFGNLVFHLSPITTNPLLPGCLDSLALGALLAINQRKDSLWLRRFGWIASLLVVAEVALEFIDKGTVLRRDTLVLFCVLSAAAVVDYAASRTNGRIGRMLSWKALTAIGTISYGIYLYHMPVHVLSGMSGIKTVILTLLVAALSWHLIEKPINSLKSRFSYPVSLNERDEQQQRMFSNSALAT